MKRSSSGPPLVAWGSGSDCGGHVLADPDHQLTDQRRHHSLPGSGVADGGDGGADSKYRYSVAWVDSLDPKDGECSPAATMPQQKHFPKPSKRIPLLRPEGPGLSTTVSAWWAAEQTDGASLQRSLVSEGPKHRVGELQEIAPFSILSMGCRTEPDLSTRPQYQFAVPNKAAHPCRELWQHSGGLRHPVSRRKPALVAATQRHCHSPCLDGPWRSMPAAVAGLQEVLDELDEEVAIAGGRLYLAKDSRQSAAMTKKSYKKLETWRQSILNRILSII